MLWHRWRRRRLDHTGPATCYLTQSGAYTAPTWATEPKPPTDRTPGGVR